MPNYRTISNQSIFDVCISTRGDFTNLYDVISQFGNINSFVPIGENVQYIILANSKAFIQPIPIINSLDSIYLTADYQSIYDVAIQLHGDMARIDEILPIIRNLGTKIGFAQSIPFTPNLDPISLFFNNKIVATALSENYMPVSYLGFWRNQGDWDASTNMAPTVGALGQVIEDGFLWQVRNNSTTLKGPDGGIIPDGAILVAISGSPGIDTTDKTKWKIFYGVA